MSEHAGKVEAVNQYMQAITHGDLDAVMAIYAQDATVEDPVGAEPLVGAVAIREFYRQTCEMNLKAELAGQVRCSANSAAFAFTVKSLSGEPAIIYNVIDIFDFNDDGKVVSMRAYWSEENVQSLQDFNL